MSVTLNFAPGTGGRLGLVATNTAILNGQYLSTALSFDNYRQALFTNPNFAIFI